MTLSANTYDQKIVAAERFLSGEPARTIAPDYNVSKATIREWAKRIEQYKEIAKLPPAPEMTRKDIKNIKDMYISGNVTVPQITERLGWSRWNWQQFYKKHITPEEVLEARGNRAQLMAENRKKSTPKPTQANPKPVFNIPDYSNENYSFR